MINVMQNLIGNAIKHCDLPQPTIHITSEDTQDSYIIKVKDNARGIDKHQIGSTFIIQIPKTK